MKKIQLLIWAPVIILPIFNILTAILAGKDYSLSFAWVLGAVVEELFYRCFLLQHLLLPRMKVLHAILFVSVLFSCTHFFNLQAGAPLKDTLLQVLFAFCFSIWAGAAVWKTGKILPPLMAHILLNLTASDSKNMAILLIMNVFVLTDGILLMREKNK